MAAYTGVGSRIREQMMKLGYVRTDGEPDVQRFSWDFRYDRTLIYAWLADKATPFKDLIRLARDLQISVEWLLTGQERGRQETGKGSRRQGRRSAGSLVLAFMAGLGALLGSPPSGMAAPNTPQRPPYITRPQPLTSYFYSLNALSLIRRRIATWLSNCNLSPVAA